jgi:hypothetical protein
MLNSFRPGLEEVRKVGNPEGIGVSIVAANHPLAGVRSFPAQAAFLDNAINSRLGPSRARGVCRH